MVGLEVMEPPSKAQRCPQSSTCPIQHPSECWPVAMSSRHMDTVEHHDPSRIQTTEPLSLWNDRHVEGSPRCMHRKSGFGREAKRIFTTTQKE